MRSNWPPKDPVEKLVADFSFASEIVSPETIISAAISCSVLAGIDQSPSSVLNGGSTISGGSVLQPFQGGIDGVAYLLRCVATLSSGRVLVRAAVLPVAVA